MPGSASEAQASPQAAGTGADLPTFQEVPGAPATPQVLLTTPPAAHSAPVFVVGGTADGAPAPLVPQAAGALPDQVTVAEAASAQVLEQLLTDVTDLGSLTRRVAPWLTALALAATAGEVARRQLRRSRGGPPGLPDLGGWSPGDLE
jgi:hypothetical protein